MPSGQCPECDALCAPHYATIREEHYEMFYDAILARQPKFLTFDAPPLTERDRFVIAVDGYRQRNSWDTDPQLEIIIVGDDLEQCFQIIKEWDDEVRVPIAVCDLDRGYVFQIYAKRAFRMSPVTTTIDEMD